MKSINDTDGLKQVIVVRSDLKLPKGKLAAQVSHASVETVLKLLKKDPGLVKDWHDSGMKKIALKVDGLKELLMLKEQAARAGLMTALITDAGHTVVEPGTVTCLGIGPAKEDEVDRITGMLKML
jgi:PTH2 family peptidyl-tRNA hydrolase